MGERYHLRLDHGGLAVILDLFSRLGVGWAMSQHNDEQLVRQALKMAQARSSVPKEMLVHSDRGSPYTSSCYLQRLKELGIVVSMSRVGDWYDNAAMESFFQYLRRDGTATSNRARERLDEGMKMNSRRGFVRIGCRNDG